MRTWLLDWLSAPSTTKLLGAIVVVPILGSLWLFWRAARRNAPFRRLRTTAGWCVLAFCPIPIACAFECDGALQNVLRLVFLAVAVVGWWRLFRTLPALLRFPSPYEAGTLCAQLLADLHEVEEGRRQRGIVENEETRSAISATKVKLQELLTRMQDPRAA